MGVKENHGLCCPKCGRDDQLDVAASVYTRLTGDGASIEDSNDGSQEWGEDSAIVCTACGEGGTCGQFRWQRRRLWVIVEDGLVHLEGDPVLLRELDPILVDYDTEGADRGELGTVQLQELKDGKFQRVKAFVRPLDIDDTAIAGAWDREGDSCERDGHKLVGDDGA